MALPAGLFADGRHLEIFVVDEHVAVRVRRGIGVGPKRFEIGSECRFAGIVEPIEGDLRWAEVLAEEGDGTGRCGGHVEVDRHKLCLDVAEGRGEPLADSWFVSPKDGGRDSWRRGSMLRTDAEHGSAEACGVPVGHGEQAAGAQHPGEFMRYQIGTGSKHGAEHAYNGVEAAIGVGQVLGIAFVEGGGDTVRGGPLACLLKQVGGDVHTGDPMPRVRQRDGQIACAAGDVQHAAAPGQRKPVDEGFGGA